ncbi:hypothetical protein [Citrobacter gillenii]
MVYSADLTFAIALFHRDITRKINEYA